MFQISAMSMSPVHIFYHLGMAWDLHWAASSCGRIRFFPEKQKVFSELVIPTTNQILSREAESIF